MPENQPYIVSARKYRPATFQSVVGQKALTATLKNAIAGGKLAQAYLFCGPRGVGKTSCARIFAKTINCLNPTPDGEACGECESCKAIEKGASFNLIELDAASNNSVEDIRNITDQVNVPPQNGRFRVFIIDEVHMLSNSAFNAFLKTLEEPPKNVVFILATTERHKVIPTILSRCQVYDFRRITVDDIIDHLAFVAQKEGIHAEREALGIIALMADGAMRDALSIFDQVSASTGGRLTYSSTIDALNVLDQEFYFRLVDSFHEANVSEALLIFKEITDKGFDALFFINGLASHIRNLMVAADSRTLPLLETSETLEKKYAKQAPEFSAEWYYRALEILNECDFKYKTSGNKRLLVELSLIKLCNLSKAPFEGPAVEKPRQRPVETQPQSAETKKQVISDKKEVTPSQSPSSSKNEEQRPEAAGSTGRPFKRPGAGPPTSFRISDQPSASSSSRHVRQENPFTNEQLHAEWEKYITTHPEQRILVAAMRSGKPKATGDNIYTVTVSHPAQQQAFEGAKDELLTFLRTNLRNDFITLKVELSESSEEKGSMNPKDVLKMMVAENQPLARFLKNAEAELE